MNFIEEILEKSGLRFFQVTHSTTGTLFEQVLDYELGILENEIAEEQLNEMVQEFFSYLFADGRRHFYIFDKKKFVQTEEERMVLEGITDKRLKSIGFTFKTIDGIKISKAKKRLNDEELGEDVRRGEYDALIKKMDQKLTEEEKMKKIFDKTLFINLVYKEAVEQLKEITETFPENGRLETIKNEIAEEAKKWILEKEQIMLKTKKTS